MNRASSAEPVTGREWTLAIPAPASWLTNNSREHRMADAPVTKAWRTAGYVAARRARLPQGLGHVRVTPTARLVGPGVVREAPNLAPTIKAVVDGLGPSRVITKRDGTQYHAPGWGLVLDDSDRHLTLDQTVIERLPRHPYRLGHLILHIREEEPRHD